MTELTSLCLDMRQFLKAVTSSMQGSRREAATPEDFAVALARSNLTSSDFSPFLTIPSDPSICQPALSQIPDTDKLDENLDTKSLDRVLSVTMDELPTRLKHVPKHFPSLPSRHTWKATPVYQSRVQDARVLRERATQEGILAEQALRRLTEANKAINHGSARDARLLQQGRCAKSWDLAMKLIDGADADEEDANSRQRRESSSSLPPAMGATLSKVVPSETFESAAVVNSGRLRWRELARGKA